MNPKNTPHPRVALPGLALALGLFLAAAPAAFAVNAIVNENFAAGTAPWTLQLGSGASATLDNSTGWGRVLIANGGTSKSHINLEQTLGQPLVNGVTYTIAFDAYAGAAKSIDVLLRDSSAIYGATYGLAIGATPNRFSITYTHAAATAAAPDLSFRIGGNTTTLHVDNVVVTRQGQASQLLTKVSGVWQFNTLTVGGKSWNAGVHDFSYSGYNYGERESFAGIPASTQTISAAANEDITAKLNAALAALPSGGTVIIPAGSFRIGAGITGDAVVISTDNTVIKGAGAGLTTLTIDPTYHAAALVADRQEDSFSVAAINFKKSGSPDWIYGDAPANSATVSAPVALGARAITVSDPYNKLATATHVVVRQIMWPAFVQAYAYDANSSKPYKWTNYDANNVPLFSLPKYGLTYYRKILSRSGNVLTLDAPVPHGLDPANAAITVVPRAPTTFVQNSGLQDLTIAAAGEDGVASTEDAIGTSVMATGLLHGLFKNVRLDGFRSLGFATTYAVNTTFLQCEALDALNCGGGGSGYGFYIKGQNLLYKNCVADNVRHGYTTAAPQTSNIVLKNCSSLNYRFHTSITTGGESVDDTHLQYSHGLLWDHHYSKEAGLLMINRGTLSSLAYETCGWTVVWNYENEGFNTLDAYGKDLRHNLIGVTPAAFGIVVGAHKGTGPAIRVYDGYARYPATTWGAQETSSSLHVGTTASRVLYEHIGSPVSESIYDIQFAQRAKLLP